MGISNIFIILKNFYELLIKICYKNSKKSIGIEVIGITIKCCYPKTAFFIENHKIKLL